MSFYQSKQAKTREPVPSGAGAMQVTPVFGDFDLAVQGGGALAADDVIEMVPLPAGYVVDDIILDADELDEGADAIEVIVGLTDADYRQGDASTDVPAADFIAASAVGQAGGIARMDAVGATRIAPATNDRAIGIKVSTGPGTGAATGSLRLIANIRPEVDSL